MKGTSTVFLAILATALVAVAKPSHSAIAGLLHRQSSSDFLPGWGIDPSSISTPCQPDCTTIIKTLDACTTATCECTQANLAALGVCINCLTALGSGLFLEPSPGSDYLDNFRSTCYESGTTLTAALITSTPTGIPSTGDPLSIFEVHTFSSGATGDVTHAMPPLIPTQAAIKVQVGSAIGLNAFRALGSSVVVAAAAVIVMLGVSSV